MGKPRICGIARPNIPNRYADQRRRNKSYFKGLDFADKSIDRYERKLEKRIRKEAANE